MKQFRSVVSLAAIAVSTGTLCAVDVAEVWIDRLDGPAGMNDYGEAIAVAADGSVYVTGFVFEQAGQNLFSPRFMTVRYDAAGNRMWERMYAGTFASGAAAAYHIAIDVDGDIVVSGMTNQGDDWAVVKYDPAGNELWKTVYEANSTFLTEPEDMALDNAGNIYLVGDVGDGLNPTSGDIVKVTPDGSIEWVRSYYGPTFDGASFSSVAADDMGNIYAAGSAAVPNVAGEFTVVKYDSAGNFQWLMSDGYPGSLTYDRANDLTMDGAGNVIAVGRFGINSPLGIDLAVVKVSPDGSQIWKQTYAGPDNESDSAIDVVTDGSDGVIIVGYSGLGDDDYAALTLKYDSDGTFLWEQRVSGAEFYFDWATAVEVDTNDNIYVVGEYDPIGGSRFFTTRYSPDGTQEWFMDYAGPMGGGSNANDVALDMEGNVYVVGDSPGIGTESDIATIRYEQTGEFVPGDLNGDGVVNTADLLDLLAAWGACADCGACPADLNGDCTVNATDLLVLLASWS